LGAKLRPGAGITSTTTIALSVHQSRKKKKKTVSLAEQLGRREKADTAVVIIGSGASKTESCSIFDLAALPYCRQSQHFYEGQYRISRALWRKLAKDGGRL
jgi:hypothetical protein